MCSIVVCLSLSLLFLFILLTYELNKKLENVVMRQAKSWRKAPECPKFLAPLRVDAINQINSCVYLEGICLWPATFIISYYFFTKRVIFWVTIKFFVEIRTNEQIFIALNTEFGAWVFWISKYFHENNGAFTAWVFYIPNSLKKLPEYLNFFATKKFSSGN